MGDSRLGVGVGCGWGERKGVGGCGVWVRGRSGVEDQCRLGGVGGGGGG